LRDPHLQNNQSKMGQRSAQAVECLLCEHKALSSNPSATRKKKERRLCIFLPALFHNPTLQTEEGLTLAIYCNTLSPATLLAVSKTFLPLSLSLHFSFSDRQIHQPLKSHFLCSEFHLESVCPLLSPSSHPGTLILKLTLNNANFSSK
jgi:hypothetical protein